MVGDDGGYATRGSNHSPYTKGNLGRRPKSNGRLTVGLKEWDTVPNRDIVFPHQDFFDHETYDSLAFSDV